MNDLVNVTSVEIRYTSHSYKIHENHVGAPYGRRASRSCFFVSARSGCQLGVATPVSRAPAGGAGGLCAAGRGAPRAGRGACARWRRGRRTRVPTRYFQGRRFVERFAPKFLYCFATSFITLRTSRSHAQALARGYVGISRFSVRRAAPPRGRQTGRNREAGSGQGRCLGSSAHREVRRARSDGPEMVLTTA